MSEFVKYPRTFHFPWSEGATADDKKLDSTDHFRGKHVIVTEKLDGECTTAYPSGHTHARSLDSRSHESRTWFKQFWGSRGYKLNLSWRVCGENVYAKHSIAYDNLESYFYAFSVWDDHNFCVDWTTTEEVCKNLDIILVPVIFNGIYDETFLKNLDVGKREGYVVRLADQFSYKDFAKSVAKWVRKNHVQTDEHWMHGPLIKNKLRSEQ